MYDFDDETKAKIVEAGMMHGAPDSRMYSYEMYIKGGKKKYIEYDRAPVGYVFDESIGEELIQEFVKGIFPITSREGHVIIA